MTLHRGLGAVMRVLIQVNDPLYALELGANDDVILARRFQVNERMRVRPCVFGDQPLEHHLSLKVIGRPAVMGPSG